MHFGACGMDQVPPCGDTENGLLHKVGGSISKPLFSSLLWLFSPTLLLVQCAREVLPSRSRVILKLRVGGVDPRHRVVAVLM